MTEHRIARDVIVIGASVGGVEALKHICSHLPDDLPAIIGIVIHRSPAYYSDIQAVYQRPGRINVREPHSGEVFKLSTAYFAPADHHMHFHAEGIGLSRGPKVHFTRPAADVLFMSAAESFRERVAGIVLSGGGADGAHGLVSIKRYRGLSFIQDPKESKDARMPLNALREDSVDGVMPLQELPSLIRALANGSDWAAKT